MATDVQVPPLGESITQAVLLKWHKTEGQAVQRDEPLCELETDKANVDVPAPESGVLRQLKKAGETVNVGDKLARIEAGTAASPKIDAPAVKPLAKPQAAPLVVAPTPVVAAPAPVITPPKAEFDASGIRREPMSKIRKRIAENLVQAQHTAAILTTMNEIDMTAVMRLREKYKDRFMEIHGVGLGIMSFFARAVVVALRQFPRVNAFIDGDDVVYHDYVNLGIAVSTDRGLAVPVLRNVEGMTFGQIESAIKRLATATRDGKLALDELSGGTFTITNGGVYGSLLSTPILNPPQSAILGLHAIQKRPVAIDDKIEIRPMMYVALSYDHRMIDGRESVSFLVRVKQLVEDPARLVLEI